MPGLIRGVARTAAIAGTATAVSNRVSRRQANKWSQQEPQQAYEQAPPPPAPAASGTDDKLAQLKELGELKTSGRVDRRRIRGAEGQDPRRLSLVTVLQLVAPASLRARCVSLHLVRTAPRPGGRYEGGTCRPAS